LSAYSILRTALAILPGPLIAAVFARRRDGSPTASVTASSSRRVGWLSERA
jgi:hypothetical protein